MIKYAFIVMAVLFVGGCRGTTQPETANQEIVDGEFLVSREDLPSKVNKLAESLERLPRNCSRTEFENLLVTAGLNREPDWFKDFQHLWYLDSDFNSDTTLEKRKYVISIGYIPKGDSTIATYDAGIHHTSTAEHGRETIWQINWGWPDTTK